MDFTYAAYTRRLLLTCLMLMLCILLYTHIDNFYAADTRVACTHVAYIRVSYAQIA